MLKIHSETRLTRHLVFYCLFYNFVYKHRPSFISNLDGVPNSQTHKAIAIFIFDEVENSPEQ